MAEGSGYPVAVDATLEGIIGGKYNGCKRRDLTTRQRNPMQVRVLLPQLTLTHGAHGL
ncbi:MAG: hypothetical protein RLZZ94_696 [Bacteroidota bacterium]|jgi:hypothetical protein